MPKEKFDEMTVLAAALAIVREQGAEALSARAVADRAGCSVAPVYRKFGSMEGLERALYEYARKWVTTYNHEHEQETESPLLSNGLTHIRLASEEPRLFAFLYQSPHLPSGNLDTLLDSVGQPDVWSDARSLPGLNGESVRLLYRDLVVYAHGLASMVAAGAKFSRNELTNALEGAFSAFYAKYACSQTESKEDRS